MSEKARERLRYALERVRGYPAKVVTRAEWAAGLRPGGEPTRLAAPLSPFVEGMKDVQVPVVAASTYPAVAAPGYHHVRLDPKDAPNVFNTDSFDAIEDLIKEADFAEVCRVAGLAPESVNKASMAGFVFLVGPKKRSDHHSSRMPPDIDGAREK